MAQPDGTPQSELSLLEQILGDTRVRYRHHQTPFAVSERLAELDSEIRALLRQPPSPQVELEARRLIGRLHTLDPH